MNNVVERLIEQATQHGAPQIGIEDYVNPYTLVDLVVKECASLFPLQFTDEQYQRRIDKTIRKHFGADE